MTTPLTPENAAAEARRWDREMQRELLLLLREAARQIPPVALTPGTVAVALACSPLEVEVQVAQLADRGLLTVQPGPPRFLALTLAGERGEVIAFPSPPSPKGDPDPMPQPVTKAAPKRLAPGTKVKWTSQSQGGSRDNKGTVIAFVPGGESASLAGTRADVDWEKVPNSRKGFAAISTRDRYLVQVDRGREGLPHFLTPFASSLECGNSPA